MAPRRAGSPTRTSPSATSGGSSRGAGTALETRRSGGRSTAGREPTWNRSWCTSTPRARRRAPTSSARSDSSCAHTLVETLSRSTPPERETGLALSAIRPPTASRQSLLAMGGRKRAKRFSPARRRIASKLSGAMELRMRLGDFMGLPALLRYSPAWPSPPEPPGRKTRLVGRCGQVGPIRPPT
jgi:hypothetical protein